MKFIEYSQKIEKLKKLVETDGSGSPAELAEKLSISERTLLRMVQQLREHGYPIFFNRLTKSYIKKIK
jgi:biotin operon repressor